jgi:hypothetical protein
MPDLAVAALLCCTAAATAWIAADGFARADRRTRRMWLVALALALVALALRCGLVEPVYIHNNLHGPALADSLLATDADATRRHTYGPIGPAMVGTTAAWLGGGFEGLVRANQFTGFGLLIAIAWLAVRWGGRSEAAPAAVAVASLLPVLARPAASEDVHTLATLFAVAGLAALDRCAERRTRAPNRNPDRACQGDASRPRRDDEGVAELRRGGATTACEADPTAGDRGVSDRCSRADLLAGTLLLLCAVATRQTVWVMAPLAFALAALRRPGLLRSPAFLAAGLAVATVLAGLVATSWADAGDRVTYDLVPQLWSDPAVFLAVLPRHPLLAPSHAAVLLPLTVLGLTRVPARAGGATLLLFAVSLPFATPTDGDELAFRVPVAALVAAFAGSGAERIFDVAHIRWPHRVTLPVSLIAVASLMLHPLALPAFWLAPRVAPMNFERDCLAAAPLQPGATLVELPARDPMPAYRLPRERLPAGVRVVAPAAIDPAAASYFLAGVQCHAWSGLELPTATGVPATRLDLVRHAYAGRLPPGVALPRGLRPECRGLLRNAVPAGPELRLAEPFSEVPFALFAPGPITCRLYRLDAGMIASSHARGPNRSRLPALAASQHMQP